MRVASTDPLLFTAANPAAKDQPVVYVGEPAKIILKLTNNTGSDVPLTSGANGSSIELLMPSFYTDGQVSAMKLAAKDWSAALDSGAWLLTYDGTNGAWPDAAVLEITVTDAVSTAQPTSDNVLASPANMGPNVPYNVPAPLALNDPPKPGNKVLSNYLDVSVSSQGTVYVSSKVDPLPNKLFLNLKNKSDDNIYLGEKKWTGSPQINVMFVYGLTAGALAPANDPNSPPIGSAWNINAGIDVGTGWQPIPPAIEGVHPVPVWVFKPTDTNIKIIGTGDQANVTFVFSNILSFTPPGHTQMIVQFTGFMRDETAAYEDQVFILDISKQTAPPTRGLVNFFGPDPFIRVFSPDTPIPVELQWTMFDVPAVRLFTSYAGKDYVDISYPNFDAVAYDKKPFTIPGVKESGPVFFTLQSFDAQKNYLNSMQFAVFVDAAFFLDPRDHQLYSAFLVDRTLWMAQNLNYAAPGSCYYNGDGKYAKPFGRLYTIAQAQDVPSDWRLPNLNDWKSLIDAYGGAKPAYEALIAGGTTTFEARLGGAGTLLNSQMSYRDIKDRGYYWTATQGSQPGQFTYAQFSASSKSASAGAEFPINMYLSVRYVRDL